MCILIRCVFLPNRWSRYSLVISSLFQRVFFFYRGKAANVQQTPKIPLLGFFPLGKRCLRDPELDPKSPPLELVTSVICTNTSMWAPLDSPK